MKRLLRLPLCLALCCLCAAALAEPAVPAKDEQTPIALANRFFASPYIDEAPPVEPWNV